ncbi:MAG: DUF1559 domain-containing protein [Planctomycetales bacterium]|nr:DUF1559 domain-containing protein [Planctomycetales bacterium]MCA9161531.1 DUF1559 domain-containing protein [Planctomycetales bacterium]
MPDALVSWHQRGSNQAGIRRVMGVERLQLQYSWYCDVLPFVGQQKLHDRFDFSRPWADPKNVRLTTEVVPEFQNPLDPRKAWQGYPFNGLALTHFVGVSGVEDKRNVIAGKLPRSDDRAGVFGYDTIARPEEITDGQSNTLMMIGSGELASPWVQGGGATVRGAREPYFDSLTGFGTTGSPQPGSMAVMADGSVKFISADIDPTVFRAMCTIHGGESVDLPPQVRPANWRAGQ